MAKYARLFGGPKDGEWFAVPDESPAPVIYIAIPPKIEWTRLDVDCCEPTTPEVVRYIPHKLNLFGYMAEVWIWERLPECEWGRTLAQCLLSDTAHALIEDSERRHG